ncbi:hypothetical protein H4S02_006648, partial [Coemansia sp. RSA 2611]
FRLTNDIHVACDLDIINYGNTRRYIRLGNRFRLDIIGAVNNFFARFRLISDIHVACDLDIINYGSTRRYICLGNRFQLDIIGHITHIFINIISALASDSIDTLDISTSTRRLAFRYN